MTLQDQSAQAFYARQSTMTDPREHRALLDGLPTDVSALCRIVRGLILHPATAHLYRVQVDPARLVEQDTRDVASILARILALDSSPLAEARLPSRRFVGCCRDFSTVLGALLRHQGVPARPRAGCARYFRPGFAVDHWICDVWSTAETRWVTVDAQLDDVHRRAYGIDFDPHDVPADQFLVAGDAWQRCRTGAADPETFGVAPDVPVRGWRYLQSQLVRDFAALNRVELLCWDLWGLADAREAAGGADLALLDRVASLSLAGDAAFPQVRALYGGESGLRVPPVILSLETASGWQIPQEVMLPSR